MSSSSFSSTSWAEFKQGLLEIPIATTSKSNGSDDDNPGSSHGDDRNDRRTSSDDSVAIIDDGDDDGGDASDNSKLNENFTIDAATQLQSKQSSISSEICASLQVKDKSTMATHPTETITEKEKEAQLAASELLRPLTPAEEGIVKKALYAIGPPRDILASFHGDSVQRRSMQTLQPGRWINDEIVNYFFKNCLAKRDERLCSTQPGRKRSHFFNTFFVQALFDDKNSNAAKRGKYNYNNVKRWSKKVPGKDIFNLKYVVCPMNLDEMHWTLAVIFMEEKKICYYDSMGETEWTKLEGLLKYLKDEHISKKGKELEGWEEWQLLGCPDNIPSQFNGYDCGIFTCMFAYFISNDYPLAFTQQHVDCCREWIAIDIINNGATELCSSGRRTRSAEG